MVGPSGEISQISMMIGRWLHSRTGPTAVSYRQGPSVKDATARVRGEASDAAGKRSGKPSKRCGYRRPLSWQGSSTEILMEKNGADLSPNHGGFAAGS